MGRRPLFYDEISYNNKKCVCGYCNKVLKKSYIYYFDDCDAYVGYCYGCKNWTEYLLKKYSL